MRYFAEAFKEDKAVYFPMSITALCVWVWLTERDDVFAWFALFFMIIAIAPVIVRAVLLCKRDAWKRQNGIS